CLASEVRFNVNLGCAMTVLAHGCYRCLSRRLKRYVKAQPKPLYRLFAEMAGRVEVLDENAVSIFTIFDGGHVSGGAPPGKSALKGSAHRSVRPVLATCTGHLAQESRRCEAYASSSAGSSTPSASRSTGTLNASASRTPAATSGKPRSFSHPRRV